MNYSKVAISLPTPILEKADKLRVDVPRSVFITRALELFMKGKRVSP